MGSRLLATILSLLFISATVLGAQRGAGANATQPNTRLSIVGQVSDSKGQPVPDVFVTALRHDSTRSYAMVSALVHTVTDSAGKYRLDGVSVGEFYVVALPHNSLLTADGSPNRSGFANTFFPDAINFDHAQKVTVPSFAPGIANITLQPARLAAVSGVVTGSDGRVLTGSYVEIAHGDGFYGLDSRGVRLRSDGTFSAPALQPGTYFFIFQESASPLPRGVMPLVSQAKVLLRSQDVTGVQVKTIHPVRVTGRFVVAAADRSTLQVSGMNVQQSPQTFDGNPGPRPPATIRDDLSFEFQTWPGIGKLRVTLPMPFSVRTIHRNGEDLTDKFIEFPEGQQITGVEIELVRRQPPEAAAHSFCGATTFSRRGSGTAPYSEQPGLEDL